MRYLLYISFDGTDYVGYQIQKNGRSVQGELNRAAKELFGVPCDITGCSRTDSGVHARMFCATLEAHGELPLKTGISPEKLPFALNTRLPESISVMSARLVEEDFHARYSVISKEYVYRIYNSPVRSPFESGRSWHFPKLIDEKGLADMQTAAKGFVGRHDIASCMAEGSKVTSTVRTVFNSEVSREGNIITFRVKADGFLYNMVRIMTGTLVEVGTGQISPDSIPERLLALDRKLMGRTAPPEGLYLNRVFYEWDGEVRE